MAHTTRKTAENLLLFIEQLRENGCISDAAKRIRVSGRTPYTWKEDPGLLMPQTADDIAEGLEPQLFSDAWDQAIQVSSEALELSARQWAMEGLPEPVVYQGCVAFVTDGEGGFKRDTAGNKIPLTIRKRSEKLLTVLLKANLPDKYRENVNIEANITGGVLRLPPVPASEDDWAKNAEDGQKVFRDDEGADPCA